jgi:hypothetical protein
MFRTVHPIARQEHISHSTLRTQLSMPPLHHQPWRSHRPGARHHIRMIYRYGTHTIEVAATLISCSVRQTSSTHRQHSGEAAAARMWAAHPRRCNTPTATCVPAASRVAPCCTASPQYACMHPSPHPCMTACTRGYPLTWWRGPRCRAGNGYCCGNGTSTINTAGCKSRNPCMLASSLLSALSRCAV